MEIGDIGNTDGINGKVRLEYMDYINADYINIEFEGRRIKKSPTFHSPTRDMRARSFACPTGENIEITMVVHHKIACMIKNIPRNETIDSLDIFSGSFHHTLGQVIPARMDWSVNDGVTVYFVVTGYVRIMDN